MELAKTGFVPLGDCRWMRARVIVHVDGLDEDLHDVTLHAWVEGPGTEGGPNRLVEHVEHHVHVDRARPDLEVDLSFPDLGASAGSTICVHIDRHNDGVVHHGDFVNAASCPVPTQVHDRTRRVSLQRVAAEST